MTEFKSCADCLYFRPDKFLWLFIRKTSRYHKCKRRTKEGQEYLTRLMRHTNWHESTLPCDASGRGWVKKL